MTTLSVAVDAMIKVGHDAFIAAGGAILPNIVWESGWPFGVYTDDFPTIFIYPLTGQTTKKGLGFATHYRMPSLRMDLFANNYVDVMLMFEALRTAWIVDFNTYGTFAPGQGYLRHTGGIKDIEIGELRATEWEALEMVFRRTADVMVKVGD